MKVGKYKKKKQQQQLWSVLGPEIELKKNKK